MKRTPDLTILVPTFNRRASVLPLLHSLPDPNLPQGIQIEIVAIDNNSTDGTRVVLENYYISEPAVT